ncbi:hypothetical protein Q1695_012811 [Nippostrongylus brasiliensis]|nr:hypothetical protein Q1695_012811 [Nippostrongylus brasiliensis]
MEKEKGKEKEKEKATKKNIKSETKKEKENETKKKTETLKEKKEPQTMMESFGQEMVPIKIKDNAIDSPKLVARSDSLWSYINSTSTLVAEDELSGGKKEEEEEGLGPVQNGVGDDDTAYLKSDSKRLASERYLAVSAREPRRLDWPLDGPMGLRRQLSDTLPSTHRLEVLRFQEYPNRPPGLSQRVI